MANKLFEKRSMQRKLLFLHEFSTGRERREQKIVQCSETLPLNIQSVISNYNRDSFFFRQLFFSFYFPFRSLFIGYNCGNATEKMIFDENLTDR